MEGLERRAEPPSLRFLGQDPQLDAANMLARCSNEVALTEHKADATTGPTTAQNAMLHRQPLGNHRNARVFAWAGATTGAEFARKPPFKASSWSTGRLGTLKVGFPAKVGAGGTSCLAR